MHKETKRIHDQTTRMPRQLHEKVTNMRTTNLQTINTDVRIDK